MIILIYFQIPPHPQQSLVFLDEPGDKLFKRFSMFIAILLSQQLLQKHMKDHVKGSLWLFILPANIFTCLSETFDTNTSKEGSSGLMKNGFERVSR